jgi:hypothetical protein
MKFTIEAESLEEAYLAMAEELVKARAVTRLDALIDAQIFAAISLCSGVKTPTETFTYLLENMTRQINRMAIVQAGGPTVKIDFNPDGRTDEPLQ